MELFNNMVDAILACKKPVISRVNGMRVAGGQESAWPATWLSPRTCHLRPGRSPARLRPGRGSSDFLPWFLSMEDAMWNCVSCEMWSAYKMKAKTLISKCVPVLKDDAGKWVRNPQVITEQYVVDGEIVYGEFKKGDEFRRPASGSMAS